ncbi:MAG: acyl-CoA dehydrogenase [Gammaproteobacteria bacterium]|nr:acyl-CoA dehydrogenase [Gammaproteobacteria bacterium]|tara:strand:- start:2243 stop:3370 length:1128 start_codon:yes stop_codon:yes gene_type:complete
MAQPNNFGFGEDEAMLRDSARRWFEDHYPPERLHTLVAADSDPHRANEAAWAREDWAAIAELGWAAACVPEAAGGAGLSFVAALGLAEEAGRAGYPGPLEATLAATAVLNACGDAAGSALGEIAAGRAYGVAVAGLEGIVDGSTDVAVQDGRLTGRAAWVQDARKVERFVVAARGDDGLGLYAVDAAADGVAVVPDAIVDLTRDQATLLFAGCDATELAAPGQGHAALETALPALLALVAADMVGAGEWLLQTTAEYARTRQQFDRPLGFFQAIKHPLVNVMIAIDRARSLTWNAGCAVDHEPADALRFARMAKSEASDMAGFAASRAVQFHGGIGFTWECYVHMFFKRQLHSQVLLGDGRHQRAKLAELLIDAA